MKVRSRTAVAAVLAAATLAVGGIAMTSASAAPFSAYAAAPAEAPKIMIVAFHADWCPGCKVLGPKLVDEVLPAVGEKPYLVVKLDQTDKNSRQAEYMLAALGLGDLWSEHAGKTGFALVVDTETKKVLSTIMYNQEAAEITKTINTALKS